MAEGLDQLEGHVHRDQEIEVLLPIGAETKDLADPRGFLGFNLQTFSLIRGNRRRSVVYLFLPIFNDACR